MKRKHIIVFLSLLSLPGLSKSEMFSVIATNKINAYEIVLTNQVSAGKKFFLTYLPSSGGSAGSQYSCAFNGVSVAVGFMGAGPATVVLKEYKEPGYGGPQGFLVCYEISENSNLVNNDPKISSSSVVVPSDAVGDVDVLLEQSTDMITWTQCLPGTYNASTQKRFFRVRAVEK